VAAIAGLAFLVLAVSAHSVPYFPIDVTITRIVQGLSDSAALPLVALNVFGFAPIVTISYGVVVVLIFLAGLRWEAMGAGLATVGAAGLTDLVKFIVQRPRPATDLVDVARPLESAGFPAGHVLNMTAFVGFLCYLVWARMDSSWRRTGLLVLQMSMIAFMGPARIYAGAHWPSDVLGAYLIALVWLAAAIGIYQWGKNRTRRRAITAAGEVA
jgi:membrane-associated phospholipid phosphatase